MTSLITHEGKKRCWWCGTDPLYIDYHDKEWGVPVENDMKLFEMLILETFQAGLSWITILRKRENFRKAFSQFNPEKIARYSPGKIESLMLDAGIIRNRLKIESAVKNAKEYLRLQDEGITFANYMWKFTQGRTLISRPRPTRQSMTATSKESDAMAKDMKKRGFGFCGSTVMHAYMQACGMRDDHVAGCWRKVPAL